MKIRMLGTGYGECKIKKKSLKDYRKRGGVVIDERILVDAPFDIFDVAADLGFSDIFDKVRDIFISHSHPGHFSVEAIMKLASKKKIRVYASDKVLEALPDVYEIEKVSLMPFFPIELGDYRIIPTPSNHETNLDGEECLNFVFSRDKTVFYTLDGGMLNYGAWKILSEMKIDAVIAECALELKPTDSRAMFHNGFSAVKAVKDILVSSKIADENVKFVLTHIPTDRKRSVHDELSDVARAEGMTVAYDGYFFSL